MKGKQIETAELYTQENSNKLCLYMLSLLLLYFLHALSLQSLPLLLLQNYMV